MSAHVARAKIAAACWCRLRSNEQAVTAQHLAAPRSTAPTSVTTSHTQVQATRVNAERTKTPSPVLVTQVHDV